MNTVTTRPATANAALLAAFARKFACKVTLLYRFRDGGLEQIHADLSATGMSRGNEVIFHEWHGVENGATGEHGEEWSERENGRAIANLWNSKGVCNVIVVYGNDLDCAGSILEKEINLAEEFGMTIININDFHDFFDGEEIILESDEDDYYDCEGFQLVIFDGNGGEWE